jgi:hypothetical protein
MKYRRNEQKYYEERHLTGKYRTEEFLIPSNSTGSGCAEELELVSCKQFALMQVLLIEIGIS